MKRVIVGLTLGAILFCSLSPPTLGLEHNPNLPSPEPMIDDTSWGDPVESEEPDNNGDPSDDVNLYESQKGSSLQMLFEYFWISIWGIGSSSELDDDKPKETAK